VTYPRHANNRQVSNGAYQLKERIVGSHVSLIKNQFYHSVDSVYFNEVQYVSNENANSELKRYLAGELALTATIPPNDLKRLMLNHLLINWKYGRLYPWLLIEIY